MRLFVPPLKTRLRLLADWSFPLHFERRNSKTVACFTGVEERYWWWAEDRPEPRLDPRAGAFPCGAIQTTADPARRGWMTHTVPVTVPAGTVLTVDRIYIRSGGAAFDSITFRVADTPPVFRKAMKGKRFWAKLADCNRLDVEEVAEDAA